MEQRPQGLKAALSFENASLAFAAVTGLAMAVSVQLSPHGIRPIVDERAYVDWARQIAGGRLVGAEPFFLDPLPAYVLGALFALTHGSLLAARLFYVGLGVGTVAVVGALGRELFGRREGLGAMWLLALFGPHLFTLGFVLKEALTVHLTAWALLLALTAQRDEVRPRTWGALGLTSGLLMLCRGNYVPLVPLLGLWAVWQAVRGAGAARARKLGLVAFFLGVALPLSAASAHNLAAARSALPLTVMGGMNFWMGNHDGATGTYVDQDFSASQPDQEKDDFKAEAERRLGKSLTLREASNYWLGEGLKFWKEKPGAALALFARKLRLVVHDYEIPDTYAYTCFRTYFTPVLWFAPLGFGSLLGLALVGAVAAARSNRRARLPIAFFLLYGASVAAFLVFDRYRIPLCVVLCVFAAHALVLFTNELQARQVFGLLKPALMIAAATALAFVPTPVSKESETRDAYCVGQAGLMLYADGLGEQAEPWFAEARRRDHGASWLEVGKLQIDAHRAAKATPRP